LTEWYKKVQEVVEDRVGSTSASPTEWYKKAQEVVEAAAVAATAGSPSISPWDLVKNMFAGTGSRPSGQMLSKISSKKSEKPVFKEGFLKLATLLPPADNVKAEQTHRALLIRRLAMEAAVRSYTASPPTSVPSMTAFASSAKQTQEDYGFNADYSI
jgi:hypothetical protein